MTPKEIARKADDGSLTVGVIGLGYVGLPLLLSFAEQGIQAVGIDIDSTKISALNQGESYLKHIPSSRVNEVTKTQILRTTSDFSDVAQVDALFLCLPTPLGVHLEPDLSYVIDTFEQCLPYLHQGQLVVLESTTYPGTTSEELAPRVNALGLEIGKDIYLAYSPEREDPGNQTHLGPSIPKVIGGMTASCLEAAQLVYGLVYEKTVPVSSTSAAELTKLLENIFRAVNIGLVNEMKLVADAMSIDIWEVIQAASTKPFGFTPFYPGPGLGGHCIPIDPYYLTWKAREHGVHTRFIELAGEINRSMPHFVFGKVSDGLNAKQKAISGSRVLIVGLAYKPDVDDMRESPAFAIMDLLTEKGAVVDYFDSHIASIGSTREHGSWEGKKSISWTEETVSAYDAVVVITHHRCLNLEELVAWADLIIDSRNALQHLKTKPGQVIAA
jgi:UDP-N-acetyl-D-glucosamine dehydrogenase